jgi:flagellar biosynthetic protein FliQ
MDIDQYIRLAQAGVETAVMVSAPVLGFGLVAGLVVSIFQAATQINDASLAFIPKIGSVVVALLIFGNFMINRLVTFTHLVYEQSPSVIR